MPINLTHKLTYQHKSYINHHLKYIGFIVYHVYV